MLSDEEAGVHFNDSSKIVTDKTNFTFIHKPKGSASKEDTNELHSLEDYPAHLFKRVQLLNHFKNYLNKKADVKTSLLVAKPQENKSGCFFVKKWRKTSHGILFILNSGLVQVYFKDRTELFIDMSTKNVTYVDK